MDYRQKNSLGGVVGFVLFIIGMGILLPLAIFGPNVCGVLFMILTGHPM